MIIDVLMPALSPTMTEGTIVSWRIKAGDTIKRGQVIGEIQTDKAVAEWEASDAGTVAAVLIPVNTNAKVNMVAAVLTTKGEDAAAAIAKAKDANAKLAAGGAAPAAVEPPPLPRAPTPAAAPAAAPAKPAAPAPGKHVRISPVAARMAAQHGLDVRLIKGTGPDGRIIRRDIEQAAAAGTARIGAAAKSEKPKARLTRADGASQSVAMSPMRQAIGRRLLASKTQIPHFYLTDRIDAEPLARLRDELNAFDGVKVTVNDLVVRAAALALRQHPAVNATFDGTTVTRHDSADISVAVAIPDGLITPIVFKAHSLNVRQIGEQVRTLAKKAQEGALKPAEFEGGTFTISNLGMYGIESFCAIINPPQAAILAVAGVIDEPAVRGGAIVPGKTMRVTLSADHRVVDGATGAEFLRTLKCLLEKPAALLL
jgi:pyruvate dehydrogenase E2 component (dihydrolipoamide acetyltransferase)